MKKRTVPLFIGDQIVSLLVVAVLLLWTAGRIGWWPAWAANGIWVAYFVATDAILLRTSPDEHANRNAGSGTGNIKRDSLSLRAYREVF